ncbi:MAG: T9SS type A sorting domain-containing protein, partial [Bacteroidia bacterium]|nr:T9SS type A sorting domain-containing protein [Bacteroidia bacterium]
EVWDVMGRRMKDLTPGPSPLGEGSASLPATANGSQHWQAGIDVSELKSGIYFVKVRGEKEERVGKFVKE